MCKRCDEEDGKAVAFLPNTQGWRAQFVNPDDDSVWDEPILGFVLHADGEITAATICPNGETEYDVTTINNFVRIFIPSEDKEGETVYAEWATRKLNELKAQDGRRKAKVKKGGK